MRLLRGAAGNLRPCRRTALSPLAYAFRLKYREPSKFPARLATIASTKIPASRAANLGRNVPGCMRRSITAATCTPNVRASF